MIPRIKTTLCLALMTLSSLSYASLPPELDKAIDGIMDKMIQCQKQELQAQPNFKDIEPFFNKTMNEARASMKADMANYTQTQANAAQACLNSMVDKSCKDLNSAKTPECEAADKIIR